LFALGVDVTRRVFQRPFQTREFIGQAWFITKVSAPVVTALLIAGAGGAAVCADLGARTIREEIDALEVLGISPIQRLVVPRVLAMILVAVVLNGLATVVGIAGGYYFNVVVQGGTPGAYIASFNTIAQVSDIWISELKAALFGLSAGIVAAYRGLNPPPGPKGVGEAVNQSVVISFVLVFLIDLVVTAIYLQIVPPKGG
jgi:phospholipid/cholesterol/gamma-HCH transport system permease protein